jgi:TonB family protein
MNRPRIALLLLALGAALTAGAQSPFPDYVPVSMVQTEEATFPAELVTIGIKSGAATVAVAIDETGHLTDYLVTGYTHPAFATHAVAALKQWKYEAAQIRGRPRNSKADLTFDFQVKGVVVVSFSAETRAEIFRAKIVPNSEGYHACTLAQLDRIPTPTKIVNPAYGPADARSSRGGVVSVEFYIDETGRVRMPSVSLETNENNEALAAIAISSVGQWQFEPPLVRGRPVLVLAHQDFSFKPAGR